MTSRFSKLFSTSLARSGALSAAAMGCFAYGYFVHRDQLFPYHLITRGYHVLHHYRPSAPQIWVPNDEANDVRYQGQKVSELLTQPYLQGYSTADERRGVTVSLPGSYAGWNLYVSGHSPEASLIDMHGTILHRWSYDFARLGSAFTIPDDAKGYERFWVYARLLESGDLLAIFNDLAVLKIDSHSRILWARPGRFHHAIDIAADGSIVLLSRKRRVIPRINSEANVLEDFVTVLDPQGNVRREVSLLDCFEHSPYASLLNHVDRWGDLFHTNAINILDGSSAVKGPAFRKGNWLISVPRLNTVAIIDPAVATVTWALTGLWSSQHHPTMLGTGNLLVFDNRGARGRSRVIELEPLTQQVVWEYPGDTGDSLFSSCCGAADRLPNGNTLIVESTGGRALEVSPDRRLLWEFRNPARHGEDERLVATLFQLVRVRPEPGAAWLSATIASPDTPHRAAPSPDEGRSGSASRTGAP